MHLYEQKIRDIYTPRYVVCIGCIGVYVHSYVPCYVCYYNYNYE